MSMPFYVPPEQLVKDRAEYARKGIARGRSIVAMECWSSPTVVQRGLSCAKTGCTGRAESERMFAGMILFPSENTMPDPNMPGSIRTEAGCAEKSPKPSSV